MTNLPTKSKIDKIFAKSEAKAAQMTEEEINARLGPATKKFFDFAETMEARAGAIFPDSFSKIILWIAFWIAGGLSGRFLIPLFNTLDTPTIPLSFGAAIALIAIKLSISSHRHDNGLRYYLAWLFFALNALRTSNGDVDGGWIFFSGMGGHLLGWLFALIFIPVKQKNT